MIKTDSDQWKNEYEKRGIPSSFRSDPSGSVEYFFGFISDRARTIGYDLEHKKCLDIGCGTGRNAVYLSQKGLMVTAMDFVRSHINNINKMQVSNIVGVCHDVSKAWPFQNNEFDFAVDTFCFKHQIPIQDKNVYKQELLRTPNSGGIFLLTLAGDDDGYYSSFLSESPELDRKVIIDPMNGIPSVLYSKDDIVREFEMFRLMDYVHKVKPSVMHGREYIRTTHLFIFQKS